MGARWRGLGLMGVSLLAACNGEQVPLGEAKLDVTDCEETDCTDAGPEEAPVMPPVMPPVSPPTAPYADPLEPPLADVAEKDRCRVPVTGELIVEHRVTSLASCGMESGPDCGLFAEKLGPSADGGLWVVVSVQSNMPLVPHWLLRYDASGALHCKVAVNTSFSELAVDDAGNAWYARLKTVSAASELNRFDKDCQAMGAPLAGLSELRAIKNVPGQGMLIVNGQQNQQVSLFDQNGQVLWSRPRPSASQFQVALAAGASGSFLFGTSARRAGAAGVTIDALDALGNTRWQATTKASIYGAAFSNYFEPGSDQQGNLVLAFSPTDVLGQDGLDYLLDVESIDASGQTRWILRVPSALNPSVAVARDGEVFVAGPTPGNGASEFAVAVIAQDGSACRRLGYPDMGMLNDLAMSPTGHLWYAANREFGRFALIP